MGQADAANFTQPLTRVDALYFTVVTFATVGFGDVTPRSELARLTVTVQIVFDLILVGLVVRVFVQSVQRGLARRDDASESADE
jgi:voltage-gated potassium channel Kch